LTGFLLLAKKDYAWIQPPTQRATAGETKDFASLQQVLASVFAERHPDFGTLGDIERIDFRPGRRVHKVHSVRNHSEFQVDAVTGTVLGPARCRTSDLIEQLHDGSFYGEWAHAWLMPVAALALLFLVVSGIYIWLAPILKRRRRRRCENRS
jgi:uncharacterized iron-regulated membrane protein